MSDRFRETARAINEAKNAATMAKLINPVSNGIGRGAIKLRLSMIQPARICVCA
jgi:hypothetical protein